MEHMIRKRSAVRVITLAIAAALSSRLVAQPTGTPDAAAKQWLFYVDGGDYAKGWDRAGDPFKAQFTAHDLQGKLAPIREPLGAIMERKFFKMTISSTMPGLPDGKYVVVQFNSRFAKEAAAIETVQLDMEDGRWSVIGYFIGPNFPKGAAPPATGPYRSQSAALMTNAPGTKNCTHEELVEARIAKENGYTGGPNCANGP
jgi:hypothetical protein